MGALTTKPEQELGGGGGRAGKPLHQERMGAMTAALCPPLAQPWRAFRSQQEGGHARAGQDGHGGGQGSSWHRSHLPPLSDGEDVTSAKAKATSPQWCRWPPVTTCRGDSSRTDPTQRPRPRQRPPLAFLDAENN